MSTVALTGHTRGLGFKINNALTSRNHNIVGFSRSTGCGIRDYTQVGRMIETVKNFDWFINCAHPDYCQSQIAYRLMSNGFRGKILNIGSPAVHDPPLWTDLSLLEYLTQKTALYHAHQVLANLYPDQLLIWEPDHTDDQKYVIENLIRIGL
jgi:hypothetical protein